MHKPPQVPDSALSAIIISALVIAAAIAASPKLMLRVWSVPFSGLITGGLIGWAIGAGGGNELQLVVGTAFGAMAGPGALMILRGHAFQKGLAIFVAKRFGVDLKEDEKKEDAPDK